ncbi:aldose epimerase family protein [Pararhodospirillum photometricum]|uniref:Aldose 1-epimerase n=1 Tax=Pararhodospirillum photometricum DSM 122 TaxID=1150469 RepID=H6SR38_PARPM|nr:aldose epimerase family protein [Pararhodospirillum photometricum]CCG09760.1 Aldose 1-epimerase [Pararhodospirillum photometricum DSM 122]
MESREIGVLGGDPVQEIRLSTPAGAQALVLSYGATLRDLVVPLGDGRTRRVVLGYQSIEAYRHNPCYLGATIGRCANRIADDHFVLDGQTSPLPANSAGGIHLHGGPQGFSRRPWRVVEADQSSVLLALTSEDGDQGYPGRVEVTCRYHLSDSTCLRLEMTGEADAPTLLNLTNHTYFTLADDASADDHFLEIAARFHTPARDTLIPTGEIRFVEGTPYDFRRLRRIGDAKVPYDINFVLDGADGTVRPVARARSPQQDLELEVHTDQPGLLLYTGSALFQAGPGLEGQKHGPGAGFCLETYRFTDSIHQPHFPSVILRPGERYTHRCEYRFNALA